MRPPSISGQEGDGGGQAPAGTVAHYPDPGRVDAELVGVLGEPAQAGVAVLDRRGMGVFGGKSVVGGEHRDPAVGDVAGNRAVVDGDAAADHPAAVQVQHRWSGGRAILPAPGNAAIVTPASLHVHRFDVLAAL
jgi:hypothetical protein